MKVYTAKITGGGDGAASDMAGKNTPKTVLQEYRENLHAQKHSSRQSIYTKATRIFLQHPILTLYTALFVEKGSVWLVVAVTRENRVTHGAWKGVCCCCCFARGEFCHNSCRTV